MLDPSREGLGVLKKKREGKRKKSTPLGNFPEGNLWIIPVVLLKVLRIRNPKSTKAGSVLGYECGQSSGENKEEEG